jgi:predicted PurR-regulated permease PerM
MAVESPPSPRGSVDWQRALFMPLTILAWVAVVVVVAWLLGHIVKTVLTLILSAIVAFALTPLVSVFHRWMPRGLAIALAYVLGFGLIFGVGALLVSTAADQVNTFVRELPNYQNRATSLEPQILRLLHPFGLTKQQLHTTEHQAVNALSSIGSNVASQSLAIITGILGTIVDIILVLILSVYLTANGPKIASRLRSETPSPQRRNTIILIGIVNRVVGGYIRGTLTMAALIGVLVGVGMLILHVPYAVLLGILAFFMEFIPVVGVLVSGAVCVGVALTQGVLLAAIVLGYFVVVHVIEGDLIGPRVMGRAVGIHPATALIAFVAGSELFGVWGALFASPIAGLLQAIGTAVYQGVRGQDPAVVLHSAEEAAKETAAEHFEPDEPVPAAVETEEQKKAV